MPVAVLLAAGTMGCGTKSETAQLSGKVTFKGQPVPAGWITFTPDVAAGGLGAVKSCQIKEGAYDTAQCSPPGLKPGVYFIRVAGFDGKKIPLYAQGKQIFNPIDDKLTVATGSTTHDVVVPESAGKNVLIQPTADE
jgi:hypothetical protein